MKNPPTDKNIARECDIPPCKFKALHHFGTFFVCDIHYHRFKKQELIEEAKRKRNENK